MLILFTLRDNLSFVDITEVEKMRLARVLFNFHALSPREISVEKGDIVIIQRAVNHNWVEIEDSQSGLKVIIFLFCLFYCHLLE